MSTTRRQCPPKVNPDLEVLDEWNGFALGDVVRIIREPGVWRFVNHTTHRASGATWVTVVGGPKNHKSFRSFREERVKAPRRTRGV